MDRHVAAGRGDQAAIVHDSPVTGTKHTITYAELQDRVARLAGALKAKGVPVAYLEFEGEQHGFRQLKNIVRALEAEAWFYARVLGFHLADEVEPLDIDNL